MSGSRGLLLGTCLLGGVFFGLCSVYSFERFCGSHLNIFETCAEASESQHECEFLKQWLHGVKAISHLDLNALVPTAHQESIIGS